MARRNTVPSIRHANFGMFASSGLAVIISTVSIRGFISGGAQGMA